MSASRDFTFHSTDTHSSFIEASFNNANKQFIIIFDCPEDEGMLCDVPEIKKLLRSEDYSTLEFSRDFLRRHLIKL